MCKRPMKPQLVSIDRLVYLPTLFCSWRCNSRADIWEKLEAEKAAKRVFGVKALANDLEVKLTDKRTDPEIARAAVHVLENNVRTPSDKIY